MEKCLRNMCVGGKMGECSMEVFYGYVSSLSLKLMIKRGFPDSSVKIPPFCVLHVVRIPLFGVLHTVMVKAPQFSEL